MYGKTGIRFNKKRKKEVKDTVKDNVDENKIKTPFTNNRPGEHWFQNFRKRHKISVKKPEALQQCRRDVTGDPFIIYSFYDLIKQELHRLHTDNLQHLHNLDETCFGFDPSKTKVVAQQSKAVCRVTQGTGRENITVLGCVSKVVMSCHH